MAQANYTPIQLYRSTTASAVPTSGNLAAGELAINTNDGKLYYKDSGGTVQLIASKAGASGDVVGPASATDNAVVRFDGTTGKLVQNSVVTIADSTGDISGVGQLNATTVDTTNVEVTNIKAKDGTAAATIADSTGVVSITANPVLSGGTANGVLYLNGSKAATSGSALTFDASRFTVQPSIPAATPTWSAVDTAVFSQTSNSIVQLHVGASGGTLGFGFSTASTRNAGLISFDTGSPSFAFSLSGSEQMRLTSTGLGIGTSSPATKVEAVGVIRASSGTGQLNIGITGGIPYIQGYDSATAGNRQLAFYTNAEVMRLDSSGNLGIGTSSPNSKLSVAAATSTIGSLRVEGTGTGAGTLFAGMTAGSIGFLHSNTGTLAFGTSTTDNNLTERMRLDSSGNLGLGVTPSAWGSNFKAIDVGTTAAFYAAPASGVFAAVDGNNYSTSGGAFYKTNGFATRYFQLTTGGHAWYTAASGTAGTQITFTQAMTLDASGNLLVGTTSSVASTKLVVSGINATAGVMSADTSGSTSFVRMLGDATSGNVLNWQDGTVLRFATSTQAFGTFAERARITSGGDFGIGTTSPLAKLDVNGGIAPTAAPSSNWGLDFAPSTSSGTYTTIANNGTYDIATGSGEVFLYDEGGNGVAQILCYYGATSILFQNATLYSVAQGTANKVNVFYNGGTGKFRIENLTGGSKNLWLSTLRLRNAS